MYYDGNLELIDRKGIQLYIPVANEECKRIFLALESKENEMDYCIGTENEKDLQAVKERMIELNPQIKFSDYSNDQYLKNEMVR